jgi:glycosyltransferase involved in cell wall biosynthesis
MSSEASAASGASCAPKLWLEAVFVTWERHRRTRGLALRLGLQLREFIWPGSRAQRYGGQIRQTLELLKNERPRIIFVQNPSIVLAVLAILWRTICGPRQVIVVDAHNEAIEPHVNESRVIRAVAHWVLRRADFTLVTNRFLAEKVMALGGRPLVLPDPLPDVEAAEAPVLRVGEAIRVLVVATYAKDEPIEVIIEAARHLVGLVEFEFTGDFRRLDSALVASMPSNVELLGFVSEEEYWNRMQCAHAVLDLTLMDDCLVCGAYEAVAVGRPVVLSDTRALKDYFRQGVVFCRADPEDVAAALRQLRRDYHRLTMEVASLRGVLRAEWADQLAQARAAIEGSSA